jgi:hypothetical protein
VAQDRDAEIFIGVLFIGVAPAQEQKQSAAASPGFRPLKNA